MCRRPTLTPYCDSVRGMPLQLSCRQDQLAVAVCNLQKYPQHLPREYQVKYIIHSMQCTMHLEQLTLGITEAYTSVNCTLSLKISFNIHFFVLSISSVCCYLQYFDIISGVAEEDLPFYGGSVEIADFCPFTQEFSWHLSGEYQRSSFCRIQENQPGNSPLAVFLFHYSM